MKLLVTGGLGFIGSNFIRYVLNRYPGYEVVNLDAMTYAGNPANLKDVESDSRYSFVKGSICDAEVVEKAMAGCDAVVNFAAESHVDRSIGSPDDFIKTDVFGVFVLCEAAKKQGCKLLQVSTDECYGSISKGSFKEGDTLNPSSPYSASKAAGELLARSYFVTHGLPVVITRSSNNFGPFQYPEKLIPLFATNALENKQLPVYGDGMQVRDWLFVIDNCEALDLVLHKGRLGEVYNIGADNERTNMEITKKIIRILDKPDSLVQYVRDRPGHDRRYSVDSFKVRALGWRPRHSFDDALRLTVEWYRDSEDWWRPLKSGEFLNYYKQVYSERHGLK